VVLSARESPSVSVADERLWHVCGTQQPGRTAGPVRLRLAVAGDFGSGWDGPDSWLEDQVQKDSPRRSLVRAPRVGTSICCAE